MPALRHMLRGSCHSRTRYAPVEHFRHADALPAQGDKVSEGCGREVETAAPGVQAAVNNAAAGTLAAASRVAAAGVARAVTAGRWRWWRRGEGGEGNGEPNAVAAVVDSGGDAGEAVGGEGSDEGGGGDGDGGCGGGSSSSGSGVGGSGRSRDDGSREVRLIRAQVTLSPSSPLSLPSSSLPWMSSCSVAVIRELQHAAHTARAGSG